MDFINSLMQFINQFGQFEKDKLNQCKAAMKEK